MSHGVKYVYIFLYLSVDCDLVSGWRLFMSGEAEPLRT